MKVKTPDGKVAEFPDGTPVETIEKTLRQQFPAPPTPRAPTAWAKGESAVFNALNKAVPFVNISRSPEQVMQAREHPERNTIRYALPLANPMSGVGGLGGAAASMGVSGALGGASALAQGKSLGQAGWTALIDATIDGLLRGGAGLVGAISERGAKTAIENQSKFDWATRAPQEALDAIRSRLAGGRVNVPSLGGKMTAQEAVKKLSEQTGSRYRIGREELADALNVLDKAAQKGGVAKAGKAFKTGTAEARFAPRTTAMQRVAQGLYKFHGAPPAGQPARAISDIAATESAGDSGLPVGALPVAAVAPNLGTIARHLFWRVHP